MSSIAAGISCVASSRVRPRPRKGNLTRLNAYGDVDAIQQPMIEVPTVMMRLFISHRGRSVLVRTLSEQIEGGALRDQLELALRRVFPGRRATLEHAQDQEEPR